MKSVISIGNQDFISIRKNNCFYIDKTDFIREWWDNQDSVTLITRPSQFVYPPTPFWKDPEYEYGRIFLFRKSFRMQQIF